MTEVLTALERLSKDVTRLTSVVVAVRSKLVPPQKVQRIARSIADAYFGSVHSRLQAVQHRAGLADEIEFVIGAILQFSTEPREKTAYLGQVKELRPYLQEAMIDVMKARGVRRLVLSDTERDILNTLERMLPTTASSYEQVLLDIAAGKRVSWRGTGTELREVLREVMDHLAPDGDVMAAPGFKLEDDLKRPTQKQKVRFILKARRRSVGVAGDSVETVEEGIAKVVRSTYQRGSATTHASTDAAEVRKLKNYVDALLVELLEIAV
jgi:DNA-binding TFAR19-related protein (PDSD5 family)